MMQNKNMCAVSGNKINIILEGESGHLKLGKEDIQSFTYRTLTCRKRLTS